MIVVSDSSPLGSLHKIGLLALLPRMFDGVVIPPEVFAEVAVDGYGRPGSIEVSLAEWIKVRDTSTVEAAPADPRLGAGEASAILLARSLKADLILLDDMRARAHAQSQGLRVTGCAGVLEAAYQRGDLVDLKEAYDRLLASGAYVSKHVVAASLRRFGL